MGGRNGYVVAPAPAFRYRIKGAKNVETYDMLHLAWRAGVIEGFYFGTRSETDPTLVWQINGNEIEREHVSEALAHACLAAGVKTLTWGAWWCGYRGIKVRFSTGLVVEQSYNGLAVVEQVTPAEVAA